MSGGNTTPSNNLDPEEFAYFSERDVDNDGINDVIHTQTFDGQNQTYHLSENGDVILTEVDVDGDGILETTVQELDEKHSVSRQDLDGDGEVDQVKVFDAETGATIQQDAIVDGKVVHSMLDPDADGLPDVELFDSDGDGTFDAATVDSDKDEVPNTAYFDEDGDGKIDSALADVDNTDGVLETTLTADDLGSEDLGSMDTFIDMIEHPAESNADTDDYSSEV